jgi:hypothetical protein
MRILRWLLYAIVALALALGVVAFAARYADGPVAMFPGGPLRSGDFVEDPAVDWSFASGIQEIELQSSGRSRTTWILVVDGEAYIPCSLDYPPGKRWHQEALSQPDAVVRVDGRRYRRRLVRVDDPALRKRLIEAAVAKYSGGPVSDESRAWFFHLAPPAS